MHSAIFFETPEETYRRIFSEMKPRTLPPQVTVEFCRFANANSFIRLRDGSLQVRLTDVLKDAPAPALEALAYILLSKLLRRRVPAEYSERYRRYLHRKDMRKQIEELRQERGRKQMTGAQGSTHNLQAIFDELNFRYFFGLMAKPEIGWSLRKSRGTLGHYDKSHNAIVISKALDQPAVPRLAVQYVMFHEMLHIRYPVEHRGARRCVHTATFKQAERQFERLSEAKALLRGI